MGFTKQQRDRFRDCCEVFGYGIVSVRPFGGGLGLRAFVATYTRAVEAGLPRLNYLEWRPHAPNKAAGFSTESGREEFVRGFNLPADPALTATAE